MSVKEDIKAKKLAKEHEDEAKESLVLMEKLTLRKQSDLEGALQSVAEIKEARAEVEAMRDAFVKPLEDVIKLYRGYFKPAIDSLLRAEAAGKERMERFIAQSETKRAEILDEVEDAHDEEQREALIAKADKHDIASLAGLTVKKVWTGEVTDEKKIPREYTDVAVGRLKAATKAAGKDPKIPGWRAFVDVQTAVTVDKVQR